MLLITLAHEVGYLLCAGENAKNRQATTLLPQYAETVIYYRISF
jgi:hypothetical protein